jgi:transposase
MITTADTLVPDALWRAIEVAAADTAAPLRRPAPRRRLCRAGRHHLCAAHRRPLAPAATRQLGCGSPVTCWRRLRDWQRAGVWEQLHSVLLDQLGRAGQLDWSRASVDSLSVRAKRGRPDRANPTDRGKPGSKYHLLVDRRGIPLAADVSAANTHDSRLLESLVDAVPAIKGPRGRSGRPRKRPAKLHFDKGYDYPRCGRRCADGGHAKDRSPWCRNQPAAGSLPLGDRAVVGVAGRLPASAGPLRAAG